MNIPGLRPAAAMVKRDLLIAVSYRTRFITGLFTGILNLALFYYISRLVRVEGFTPETYFTFVAVGIVTFGVLTAVLVLPPTTLRQELVAGTFERMLLAPGGTVSSVMSLLLYPAAYALFTAVTVLGFGALIFDLDLQWSTVPLTIPLAVLGTLAFAPLGLVLLGSVIIAKKAPPGAGYLVMGLTIVGGLYFPVALLPGWIEWASEVQPLTPAVELFRNTLAGQPLSEPAGLAVAKLGLFAAVAFPLSLLFVRASVQISRRRGEILEY